MTSLSEPMFTLASAAALVSSTATLACDEMPETVSQPASINARPDTANQ